MKERVEEARHCLDLLEKVNKGRLGQDNIWVDGCEGTNLLEQMEGCLAMGEGVHRGTLLWWRHHCTRLGPGFQVVWVFLKNVTIQNLK